MSDSDKAGSDLAFGVLGPLHASYAGAALPLGGGRQRAVLAMLVFEVGHAVPVERLVDCLWGEGVPPGAVTSVQTYVFHLRQALEPGRARGSPGSTLVTVPGGYLLDVDPRCVDLARFEEGVAAGDAATKRHDPARAVAVYNEALSLWRGDVLADLTDYDFVAPYRARLDELRASALQSRVQAELDLGHHLEVVGELGVLLSENPLREGLHAQRILALYRSGRQSDALAAYRDLRSVLDTELGIEPSPPLQELNTRVLRQDPLLDWTPPARTAPASVVHTPSPVPPAYLHEGQRRRLPALALVAVSVAALAGGAGLPIVEAPRASAAVAANSVTEIDASGRVLASVPVGTNPIAVAFSHGAIWVVNASDDTVSKINPATHAVQDVIDVGHEPRAIAATGDDLWVTNFGDGSVSRINVEVGREVDTIAVGSGPDAIAAGPAGLWVANSKDNTIQRIDSATSTPEDPIDVGDGPDGLAVDDTSVWVANGRSGSVMRIDVGSGDEMRAPIRVGSGPRGIIRVGDDVWVADELSQDVTRIDVSNGRTATIPVGDGPSSVVAFGGSIWVAERYSGDLVRIDPGTGKQERIEIHAPVHGLAVAGGHLWIASGAFPSTSHRGGILRIAAHLLPGQDFGMDPARVYDATTHHAVRGVYDGLVAYHYASADPQVLVPDLAISVPEPTNGDKTYTFNLRPGIRYSTGAEVKASDFVRGVQRALVHGPRRDFYKGIVGGRACKHGQTSCDLSNGVVADDAAGRVTFHLVAPDPQFLYKLTTLVVPTPPGTPLGPLTGPLPGTGPYRIAAFTRDQTLTLARNPYFDQWSAAAQPDGFLDGITWDKVADAHEAADAVQHGRADLAEVTAAPRESAAAVGALLDELRVEAPSRVHRNIVPTTAFGILNPSVPPFDSLQARQAFNHAVDRNKVVELFGGPSMATPTCQLVPPGIPSYTRYCPYTTGRPDGDYEGPDLARAHELVEASGTEGMNVTVTRVDYQLDTYFATVLRKLGYRVTLLPYTPRNHVGLDGFAADFPLPSNFYEIVACGADVELLHDYCNRELDLEAAAASEMLQTDPAEALRAWTEIDRAVTDQAPLVPVANPVIWWITSDRVGNYQPGAQDVGPLLSRLWVQ